VFAWVINNDLQTPILPIDNYIEATISSLVVSGERDSNENNI
jgi:hypothetical protein